MIKYIRSECIIGIVGNYVSFDEITESIEWVFGDTWYYENDLIVNILNCDFDDIKKLNKEKADLAIREYFDNYKRGDSTDWDYTATECLIELTDNKEPTIWI